MVIVEILLVGLSLSVDALAVAIAAGLSAGHNKVRSALKVGFFFGFFQMMMPVIGYFAGSLVNRYIEKFAPWVVLVVLCLVGLNMIRGAFAKEEERKGDITATGTLVVLAISTSIDALAAGLTFAVTEIPIFLAAPLIGVTTFVLCFIGFMVAAKLGERLGERIEKIATVVGGLVLIGIGIKTVLGM